MPATKRKTTPIKRTPTVALRPIPVHEPQKRPLTGFQELVADCASDLILRGGHPKDIEAFLTGIIGHDNRRQFGDELRPEHMQERITRWRDKLAVDWFQRQAVKHTEARRMTVTDRIRSSYRSELASKCENFTKSATPEEVFLMNEVLDVHEGSATNTEFEVDKSTINLAEAFAWAMRLRSDFIRVPKKHTALVQQYVNLLGGKIATAAKEVK